MIMSIRQVVVGSIVTSSGTGSASSSERSKRNSSTTKTLSANKNTSLSLSPSSPASSSSSSSSRSKLDNPNDNEKSKKTTTTTTIQSLTNDHGESKTPTTMKPLALVAAARSPAATTAAATKKSPSLSSSTTTAKSKVPPLQKLLKRKNFSTITTLLLDGTFDVDPWFSREYTFGGENCLHYLMRYRPTTRCALAMIRRLRLHGIQDPELSVDAFGRTPLHLACLYRCDVSVVDALLSSTAGMTSTRVQDVDGCVPLHIAVGVSVTTRINFIDGDDEECISCRRLFRFFPFSSIIDRRQRKELYKEENIFSAIHTVKLLLGVSPMTCLIKDDHGKFPIEYVQTCPRETVSSLWSYRGGWKRSSALQLEKHQKVMSLIEGELEMSYFLCSCHISSHKRNSGTVLHPLASVSSSPEKMKKTSLNGVTVHKEKSQDKNNDDGHADPECKLPMVISFSTTKVDDQGDHDIYEKDSDGISVLSSGLY